MKCPACGAAELIHKIRDVPYTYKGQTTTIYGVAADWCPACGEGVSPLSDNDTYMEQVAEFIQEVNASYVDPAFITLVRKKLALDQQEAARIFGGGKNAFSRYENGRAKPPMALVYLLKLLDKRPALMADLRLISGQPIPAKKPAAKRTRKTTAMT